MSFCQEVATFFQFGAQETICLCAFEYIPNAVSQPNGTENNCPFINPLAHRGLSLDLVVLR